MASELEKLEIYEVRGMHSRLYPGIGGRWVKRDEALAAAEKDIAAAEQRGALAGRVQAYEDMREEMHETLLELRGQPAFEDYCQAYKIVMDVAEKKRDEAAKAGE